MQLEAHYEALLHRQGLIQQSDVVQPLKHHWRYQLVDKGTHGQNDLRFVKALQLELLRARLA